MPAAAHRLFTGPSPAPRSARPRRLAGPLCLALACAPPASPAPSAGSDEPVSKTTSDHGEPPPADPVPKTTSDHGEPASPALAESGPKDISPPPAPRPPPPGLVDLRAVLPGACFDIRYHTADNFTGAPLPGYGAPGAWLRERPAQALARAQAALGRDGLTLLVYDAYRPARASLAMVAWAERSGQRRLVDDGYIARRSGHNRGDTVDLTLAGAGTCAPLDMGTPWDHLGPESHPRSAAGEPLHNRLRLRRTMRSVGFFPYDKEWWHFTFRDPGAIPLDIPYRADDTP